jgi:hypothetical protein
MMLLNKSVNYTAFATLYGDPLGYEIPSLTYFIDNWLTDGN